jgi:hypothetical protein
MLILIDTERAGTDKRFQIDVLRLPDGTQINPADPDGDGYEADLFALMSRAMFRIPRVFASLRFQCTKAIAEQMTQQALRDPRATIAEWKETGDAENSFRGIPIEILGDTLTESGASPTKVLS